MRWVAVGLAVIVGAVGLALVAWHLLDGTPAVAEARPAATTFDADRLLVLTDGDMAATAYAGGILHPISDVRVQLFILSDFASAEPTRLNVPASNTVMGWPGATTASVGGVLPEDAVFDAAGDQIAVVVYQDHNAPRSNGWVAFFDVDLTGTTPRVQPTNRRIPLPRGAHDLYVID